MAAHAPAPIAPYPPTPAPGTQARPYPKITLSLVDHHLAGQIYLDYVVIHGGHGGRVVRVHFPDDARALLESLSWRPGLSILGALDDVGRTYLESLARAEVLADADLQIQVSLSHLRAAISSLVPD